jgi:hypothetical protein
VVTQLSFTKIVFILLFTCLAWTWSVSVAQAQVITEVLPAPSSGQEWIEIHNPSSETVVIGNWSLWDELTQPSQLYVFPVDQQILGQEILLIPIQNKLNNTGDSVILKNHNQQVVQTVTYTAAQVGLSWSSDPLSLNWSWQTPSLGLKNSGVEGSPQPSPTPPSPIPSPTPPSPSASTLPSASPSPSPTPTPSPPPTVVLSEVLSCPESGSAEWIELYNPNGTEVAIQNWQVIDNRHQTRLISGVIPGYGVKIFSWESSLLNNSGDELQLLTDSDQLITELELLACQAGQSWSRINDQWVLTKPPTPGVLATTQPSAAPINDLLSDEVKSPLTPLENLTISEQQPDLPDLSNLTIPDLSTVTDLPLTPVENSMSPSISQTDPTPLVFPEPNIQPLAGAIIKGAVTMSMAAAGLYARRPNWIFNF